MFCYLLFLLENTFFYAKLFKNLKKALPLQHNITNNSLICIINNEETKDKNNYNR